MSEEHIHEEMIVDFVLGNLSSEDHFIVTRHLKNCQKCALDRDAWHKFLFDETVVTPSEGTKHKLTRAISGWKRKKIPQYVVAVASVFIVSVVGALIFQLSNQQLVVEEDSNPLDHHVDFDQSILMSKEHTYTIPLKPSFESEAPKLYTVYEEISPSFMNLNNKLEHDQEQVIILRDGSVCLFNEQTIELTCYKLLPKK